MYAHINESLLQNCVFYNTYLHRICCYLYCYIPHCLLVLFALLDPKLVTCKYLTHQFYVSTVLHPKRHVSPWQRDNHRSRGHRHRCLPIFRRFSSCVRKPRTPIRILETEVFAERVDAQLRKTSKIGSQIDPNSLEIHPESSLGGFFGAIFGRLWPVERPVRAMLGEQSSLPTGSEPPAQKRSAST